MTATIEEQAHDAAGYTNPAWKSPAETVAAEQAHQTAAKTSYGRSFIATMRQYAALVGQPDPALPTITGLVPSTKVMATGAFTLTVNGTKFYPGSIVQWNGVAVPTTYVSGTQLTAQITAQQIAAAATVPVTVRNDTAVSPASNFTITATAREGEEEPEIKPDMSWLKADIVGWLLDKGVEFDESALNNMTKTELLSLAEDVLSPATD